MLDENYFKRYSYKKAREDLFHEKSPPSYSIPRFIGPYLYDTRFLGEKGMIRFFLTLVMLGMTSLGFAEQGAMNFTPPPGDLSVVFLSNLFGLVDGVLHGTGGQMLGNLFAVFNSAVIALGGIIIMYTLIVSTMNTAHEGQFLGQKWSSIWVPVRAVSGIALLMPKASGYCMVQIFVMWVCVQGVGAADKVWEAALSYLNRGGVIIHQQTSPETLLGQSAKSETSGSDSAAVIKAASVILHGQVCMLGLQKALELVKNTQGSGESKTGPCVEPKGVFVDFCNRGVPDFLSTVNAVSVQQNAVGVQQSVGAPATAPPTPPLYAVPMPNFSEAPYSLLNGICGTIKWRGVQAAQGDLLSDLNLNDKETETVQLSRAIALQQMYVDLSAVAQAMVNNSPILEPKPQRNATAAIPKLAWTPFGAPLDQAGVLCSTEAKAGCTQWGVLPGSSNGSALLNGAELYGALADYRAVMMPSQRLLAQGQNLEEAKSSRAFIEQANREGWLMAGSYFFRLARLNQTAINAGIGGDRDTGLESSTSSAPAMMQGIANLIPSQSAGCSPVDYACVCRNSALPEVCQWLQGNSSYTNAIQALISGDGVEGITRPVAVPNFADSIDGLAPQYGPAASTVGGYITNALIYGTKMASQPGQDKIPFEFQMKLDMHPSWLSFPLQAELSCDSFLSDPICNIKAALQWFVLEFIMKILLQFFMDMVANIVSQLFMLALSVPLKILASEFVRIASVLELPNVNPIIALANMGVEYINAGMQHWVKTMTIALVAGAVPIIAPAIAFLLLLIGPIIGTWVGVMVTTGFLTAYYVPIIPYMVFTFGTIAWLMAVIEAMVAAPIVALGVSSPEGDQAFGKGEQAIMLLMNVFLRPSMMIIGYIAGIMMSYVGVWILMTGFSNALAFVQGGSHGVGYDGTWGAGDQYTRTTVPNEDFVVDVLSGQPQENFDENDRRVAQEGVGAIYNFCSSGVNAEWTDSIKNVFCWSQGWPWKIIECGTDGGAMIREQMRNEEYACIDRISKVKEKLDERHQRIGQSSGDINVNRLVKNTRQFCDENKYILWGQENYDNCLSGSHIVGEGIWEEENIAKGGYAGWAGAFSVFFMVLIFTTMYITIVQESFNLIATLPDKILRWIGGQQETFGGESQKWAGEAQKKIDSAGTSTGEGAMAGQAAAQDEVAGKIGGGKDGKHTVS